MVGTLDTPTVMCRCCGEPVKVDWQTPIVKGKPGFHYLTCWNKACQLNEQTFTDKSYDTVDLTQYMKACR